MDNLNFNTSTKKSKILYSALAVIGVACVVCTIAFTSSETPSIGLQQFQLEVQEFDHFINKYNKVYSTVEEYSKRFKVYRDNLAYIRIHNTQSKNWVLKSNQFSDMSFAEFKSKYLGTKPVGHLHKYTVVEEEAVTIPDAVDWRLVGAVTPVKNQGGCGSCWSFSTTGAIEGAWFLAKNELVSLSEQELVDCSRSYGNQGCDGGLMDYAFDYVIKSGITTESNYPYTGKDGTCNKEKAGEVAATISGYKDVAAYNSTALLAALSIGPVSVAVQADQAAFQFYSTGVVDGGCGTDLDHGVLAVGFNTTTTIPFYIVKNSWGAGWGENGFIRLGIKEGAGVCGIQMMPSYPIV